MRDSLRIALAVLPIIAGACASNPQGEKVRDARIAAIDANAEAAQKEIDERAQARAEAIASRFDSREDKVEDADRPAEDPNETLVEVQRNRAEYESQMTARLNKLAVRINAAQAKIDVLGGQAPLSLRTELETASQQYNLIKSDVMKLDSTPPSDWTATKREIDEKTAKLDDHVSHIDERIDDV